MEAEWSCTYIPSINFFSSNKKKRGFSVFLTHFGSAKDQVIANCNEEKPRSLVVFLGYYSSIGLVGADGEYFVTRVATELMHDLRRNFRLRFPLLLPRRQCQSQPTITNPKHHKPYHP
jgi:hypothetical protein